MSFPGTWNMEPGTAFRSPFFWLLIILAAGLLIRISLLGLHRLHMDECLYSSYAIRMVTHGDIALNGGLAVDKPPLFFYALAASFLALGTSENAARLPNIIFSLITVLFIYRFALKSYNSERTGLLAAFFAAGSVMFTLFSVTAFQDILMTMLFVMSLYHLKEKRVFASSLCFFLSITAKPMTLFLFPLLALFWILDFGFRIKKEQLLQFIKAALFVLVPLFLWSALLANPRLGIFKFFITQQPEAMTVSFDPAARLREWMTQSEFLMNGFVFFSLSLAGTLIAAAVYRQKTDSFVFISIIYIYLVLSVLRFRQYDRYVLILLPFLSIAAARTVELMMQGTAKFRVWSSEFGVKIKTPGRERKIKNEINKHLTPNTKLQTAIIAIIAILYIIPVYNLPVKGPAYGALYDDADGFEQVAYFLKSRESRDARVVYYGHTISWYGYFYLAESGFYSAEPVYDTAAVLRLNDGRKNYIVADTGKTAPADIKLLEASFKRAFSVPNRDGREKYIVLEN